MHAQGDDKVTVYADGVFVDKTSSSDDVKLMKIPRSTTAIALKGENENGRGEIVCKLNNFTTDITWRCTAKEEENWETSIHNIKQWAKPRHMSSFREYPFKLATGIWTGQANSVIYCVKNIGMYISCYT